MPYKNFQSTKKFVRPRGGKNYTRKNVRNSAVPSMSKPTYRKRRYPMKRNRGTPYNTQKINVVLQNTETQQDYLPVPSTKIDQITNIIGNTASDYLAKYLQDIPAFDKYKDTFRYVRCRGIKITLIPQTWNATTLTTGATAPELQNGEKPRIHYIHDVGQTGAWLNISTGGLNPVSIEEAESFGKTYREGQFTKPYNFWIKPLAKLGAGNPSDTVGSGQSSWQSHSMWFSTTSEQVALSQFLVPNRNLFFGFTNVPTDFTYKTIIKYYLSFKEVYCKPTVPFQMMKNLTLETVQEEKEENKENLNSLPPL